MIMKRQFLGMIAVIMLPVTAYAQEAPAPALSEPLIPVDNNDKITASPTSVEKGPDKEKTEQKPVLPPVQDVFEIKSLFFSASEIKTIHNARLSYENNIKGIDKGEFSEDDFLKKLEKITTTKSDLSSDSFTYPQFFLSSIAYYANNDWVVWVNNEKFTQDSGVSAEGLSIAKIDNEKVTFEWKPSRMDKIVDTNEYSESSPVKVDMARNKVVFVLKGNQTFSSYAMQVVEGKVPPVTITTKTSASEKK